LCQENFRLFLILILASPHLYLAVTFNLTTQCIQKVRSFLKYNDTIEEFSVWWSDENFGAFFLSEFYLSKKFKKLKLREVEPKNFPFFYESLSKNSSITHIEIDDGIDQAELENLLKFISDPEFSENPLQEIKLPLGYSIPGGWGFYDPYVLREITDLLEKHRAELDSAERRKIIPESRKKKAGDELQEGDLRSAKKARGSLAVWEVFEFSEILFPVPEVFIGRGNYGSVLRAALRGTPVAVKNLEVKSVGRGAKELSENLKTLSACAHLHLVKNFGVATSPQNFYLISELMEKSLYDVLHPAESASASSEDSERTQDLNLLLFPCTKLHVLVGIARGISFMHSKNFVHGNLNSRNILLDKHIMPKISDFGVFRSISESGICGPNVGTVGSCLEWVAPELLSGGHMDRKVDAYSFGMINWEICSEKIPFSEQTPKNSKNTVSSGEVEEYRDLGNGKRLTGSGVPLLPYQILMKIISGSRPEISEVSNLSNTLGVLTTTCWDADPGNRPEFPKILEMLRQSQREATEIWKFPRNFKSYDWAFKSSHSQLTSVPPPPSPSSLLSPVLSSPSSPSPAPPSLSFGTPPLPFLLQSPHPLRSFPLSRPAFPPLPIQSKVRTRICFHFCTPT
jgi:serine/threonine protein kinase